MESFGYNEFEHPMTPRSLVTDLSLDCGLIEPEAAELPSTLLTTLSCHVQRLCKRGKNDLAG